MQLSAVRVFVRDLSAATPFYADRLGLPVTVDGTDQGWCVLRAGDVDLVLEAVAADAPADDQALVGRFTGLSFAVDDIEARYRSLQALGVPFAEPPARQPWGGVLATFTDPAGNALQLVQHPDAG